MAAQQFSIRDWLKAAGWPRSYESIFLSNGYTTYSSIVKLSRDDLEAADLEDLSDEVDDLKALGSEDQAIRVLSVSELVYACTWLIIVCL